MPGIGIGLSLGMGGGGGGGAALSADKATYLASVSAGALIATIGDPYGSGSTFSVVGSAPSTLALASGGRIVAGNGAQAAGAASTIAIRAAKGSRAIEEPLTFTAQAGTGTGTPTPGVAVAQPSGFTFTGPYTPVVTRSGSGVASTFTTDYSEATRKARISPTKTLYVRLSTGNNANDGLTPGTAFRGLRKAVDAANKLTDTDVRINFEAALPADVPVIYHNASTQTDGSIAWGDAWRATDIAKNIIFQPSVAGGVAYNAMSTTVAVTWAATADANIWVASITGNNLSGQVFDFANRSRFNSPRKLAPLLTTPADAAAPWPEINALYAAHAGITDKAGDLAYSLGAMWRDATNGKLYVRTFDNRQPDASILRCTGDATLVAPGIAGNAAASYKVYIEGLRFVGPTAGTTFGVRAQGGFRPQIDLVRCGFLAGSGPGAMSAFGATTSDGCDIVAYQSYCHGGTLDGWNYHQACTAIEIDCGGDWNGWDVGGLANNGSTAHETCQMIRIGGSYRQNQDRSLHDIGDTYIWMAGVSSSTRRGTDGSEQSTPFAAGASGQPLTTRMWLDACTVLNGKAGAPQYPTEVYGANSILRYANLAFTPVAGPGNGTVQAYAA